MRHRLTLSLTYAIPGRSGYGQMLRRLGTQFHRDAAKPAVLGADRSGNRRRGNRPAARKSAGHIELDALEFLRQAFRLSSQAQRRIPFFPGASNSSLCSSSAGRGWWNCRGSSTASLNLVRLLRQGQLHYDSAAARAVRKHGAQSSSRTPASRTSISRLPRTGTWVSAFTPSSAPSSSTFSIIPTSPILTADRMDLA